MSDMMNLTEKIPYAILLLFILAVVLNIYIGGNLSLELNIDDAQKGEYGRAVVLENVLSLDASSEELEATSSSYSYNQRRAITPVEFFTNEDPEGDEIGYEVSQSGHCYIEEAGGLDGEEYGFFIRPDYSNAGQGRSLGCTSMPDLDIGSQIASQSRVFSELLLVRKADGNQLLPARVFIYRIP